VACGALCWLTVWCASHTALVLLERGFKVLVLDSLATSTRTALARVALLALGYAPLMRCYDDCCAFGSLLSDSHHGRSASSH